jgi:kumamolisin
MVDVPAGYRKIEGSERRVAPGARRTADADPNEKFSFTVRLQRRPDTAAAASQDYWMANPPDRRRFLTRDQLIARAGARQADLDKVSEFARSQGFEVLETSTARRTVRLSGTVAQANRAFAVDLGRYESAEESYRGREGPVHLPNEMADLIQGVFGLDNRRVSRNHGSTAPAGAVPLTPLQVAKLYNFPPLNAKGQTVGIIEFGGGFNQGDLNTFCAGLHVPTPTPNLISVDGASTTTYAGSVSQPRSSDQEVALDVQVVAAIAQQAGIVMFFAPNTGDGWIDAVTTAIYETSPPLTTLSISWGGAEDIAWVPVTMSVLSEAFRDAAELGISIFADSGDFGSNGGINDGSAHVQFPASDTWVTACGGTYIANISGGTFTEGTWNDPTGATGGGVSSPGNDIGFPVPPWQANLKATLLSGGSAPLTGRGVPDIAGNASPYSGYNITVYGATAPFATGGTSAVCPLYASLFAIFAAATGWPLGFVNPLLYAVAASTTGVIIDIKDSGGNNELDPSVALPNNPPVVPCPAFVSTSKWDACTGLGRIDGTALLKALVVQEETRPFDLAYPFSFGGGGEWLNNNAPTYEGPNQWSDPSIFDPLPLAVNIGSKIVGEGILAGCLNQ